MRDKRGVGYSQVLTFVTGAWWVQFKKLENIGVNIMSLPLKMLSFRYTRY